VLAAVSGRPGTRWVVVDGAPIVHLDSTGADTLAALADELAAKGVRLTLADVHARVQRMLERSGALERLGADAVFPTLRSAVERYESRAANQMAEVVR
jgi:anti-anti-sigma regulatory factor